MEYPLLQAAVRDTPFVDHHVHAPENIGWIITAAEMQRPFTESSISEVWRTSTGMTLTYRWMIRELARVLDIEPEDSAVIHERNQRDPVEYQRFLADDVNLGPCCADHLFASDISYSVNEWAAVLDRPVHQVLRIETFIEQQAEECVVLDEALDVLKARILRARESGIVSLKSIAGYRTGLDIEPPSPGQLRLARQAYHRFREARLAGEDVRIETKELVDTILWNALDAAARVFLPCQFHVGLGDDDIVMTKNDPTLMRAILRNEWFQRVPLVLLHCYPYHRQAAYLATLYPNVYVDLGLTIPLTGPGSDRILAETLELAPLRQVMASTDGHGIPEFQWFGVFVWRWALERVFSGYLDDGIIDEESAALMARMILGETARGRYALPEESD